jgi:hypothetical protein
LSKVLASLKCNSKGSVDDLSCENVLLPINCELNSWVFTLCLSNSSLPKRLNPV